MSETSYTVEFAKSGRAKCKKCKEPIGKGDMRIGALTTGGPFDVQAWYHPCCFKLPKKLCAGANKVSPEEFVADLLEDTTGGEILPSRADEIAAGIASAAAAASAATTKKKKKKNADLTSLVGRARAEHERMLHDKENGVAQEPALKRAKVEGGGDSDGGAVVTAAEVYGSYHKHTVDQLKDVLRWNRQFLKGNKEQILGKIIDGQLRGRLALCPLCDGGGRLKLSEDCETVTCNGTFDEDLQVKISCSFQCPVAEAPRWKPWFTNEPNDEENAEMDRLEAKAKGEDVDDGGKGGVAGEDATDPDLARLIQQAKTLDWKLNSGPALKETAKAVVDVLLGEAHGSGERDRDRKTVDIPGDRADAVRKVGPVLAEDTTRSAEDTVKVIVKRFGFREDKQKRAAKKEGALLGSITNPKNAPLVLAFQELAELYFKEGNRNAGGTYNKVVHTLKNLSQEVTEDNAKGFGKGKTKIEGIGKSSADKMYEFCTTGTMEKLEQKRADAA